MTPTPIPVPTDLAVDPNRVTPGLLGFLSFAFMILVVVVIYFGVRRQLTRIDFDEGAMPAGVKPLPKYATKDERRKTAMRLQKEREAALDASAKPKAPDLPPDGTPDGTPSASS